MKKLFILLCLTAITLTASAEDLTLVAPELEPKLTYGETMTYRPELRLDAPSMDVMVTANHWKPDFDFFKSKTNPGVKPYKFMDDMTFVGVPLFVAGWAIKGDKAMFRVNNKNGKPNTQLLTDFKTGIDDYTQFFGPVMTVGLKLGGVEGRSDWPRLLASAAMSYGIMAGLVNGIKYSAKEMRPDGSTANSWPSGHTATSFVGATLLHKEYGLTRSPWYSVAGYGVATATGVMRVLNNRHWVSDVMSGAGIGILSTELGYALGDLLFKGKGLLRNDLEIDSENPSFFGISMGLGLGGKDIDFDYFADMQDPESHGLDEEMIKEFSHQGFDVNIDFRSATVVDAEGAYFFNKYVGVGGRFRVRAMSAKSFGQYADISVADVNDLWNTQFAEMYKMGGSTLTPDMYNVGGAPVTEMKGIVKSDHLAEFTGSVGLYFNIPLSSRLSLGMKTLIGRSFTQELDIDGYAKGNVKNIPYYMLIQDGKVAKDVDGSLYFAPDAPESTGEAYEVEWDYLKLGASSSTSWGTGISLTYRYKSNFSWRLYCDYDYSEKKYTLTYDSSYYLKRAVSPGTLALLSNPEVSPLAGDLTPYMFKKDKKMHYVTIGLSFLVNL
jgi:membrane-associated phospholipid phosphatase